MCLNRRFLYVVPFFRLIFAAPILTDNEYASLPTLFQFDDYDRCMLYGKEALYCSVTFQLKPKNITNPGKIWNLIEKINSKPSNYRHDLLRHGICIPHTCHTIEDLSYCYNKKYENLGLVGDVIKMHCENQNFVEVDVYDVVFAAFVILYLGFVIFASVNDCGNITQTTLGKIRSSFSIPNNFHRLRHISDDPEIRSLSCMQGIRFYNMFWVILSHTFMVQMATATSNPLYPETMNTVFLNSFLTNGGYVVQTFFLLSGWLLTYNIFKTFEKKSSLELKYLAAIFFFRYIRLTPTLAVVIAFHATWLRHISRGPFWDNIVGEEFRNCRQNWWTNLLYVNNYVNKEKMCLQQSWYLAADTQLFLMALIVIYLMKRYKTYVWILLAGSVLLGMLVLGIISYVNDYDILIRQYPEPLYTFLLSVPQWHVMYSSSYSNLSGYVIGLTFGYIFYKTRGTNLFTSKKRVALWWILAFGLPISMILPAGRMYQEDYKFTKLESSLYWAFGRNVFVVGVGVGIFGMSQNIGWFVLWVCRWKPAQIMGRLTYSAYIVHVGLIKLRVSLNRQPFYLENYLIMQDCFSNIVMSYLVATLMTLMVEMPISALQKFAMRKDTV